FAQEAAPKPPAPEASAADVARARKLHATGQRFFDQGDYLTALDAFEQAYAAAPRPNLLLSQAACLKKLYFGSGKAEHKAKAIALYRRFLSVAPKSDLTVTATAALESLGPPDAAPPAPPDGAEPTAEEKPRTTLALDSTAEGASIQVDDLPPVKPPASVEVTPGRHTVRVTAAGYEPREVTLQALPNQATPETIDLVELRGTLELDLPTEDAIVHVDGQPLGLARSIKLARGSHFVSVSATGRQSQGKRVAIERGATTRVGFDLSATPQRYAALSLIGVGGAGLVAGAVTLGLAADRDARAAEIDTKRLTQSIDERELDEYEAVRAELDTFRAAGIATTVAGGAVGALGIGLFFADNPSPVPAAEGPGPTEPATPMRTELAVVPSLGPSFAGIAAWGSF
ncbi:MAG: PEGA domain-containing protein, partial [Myxococcales bacterium]|nr:PEGA domain-containing protein [Myxococcales bacterium]